VALFDPSGGLVVVTPIEVFDCDEAPEPLGVGLCLDCCEDSTGILICSVVLPESLATVFGLVYREDRLKSDSAKVCFCFRAAISFCLSVYESLSVTARNALHEIYLNFCELNHE
jgi:hypothetical protein